MERQLASARVWVENDQVRWRFETSDLASALGLPSSLRRGGVVAYHGHWGIDLEEDASYALAMIGELGRVMFTYAENAETTIPLFEELILLAQLEPQKCDGSEV